MEWKVNSDLGKVTISAEVFEVDNNPVIQQMLFSFFYLK